MLSVSLFSPAKINLFLAVTGRRPDGFHDLVSLVAPLAFGDTLHARLVEPGNFSLRTSDPSLASDDTNLVIKAAKAFQARSGWEGGAFFDLEKRIPLGAGLGGGSSNAVAALLLLNRLSGGMLDREDLAELAAQIGSDCALFLESAPVIMRGRGERIERLSAEPRQRVSGRRVLLFKPSFGISTPWAYRQLAAGAPGSYVEPGEAEAKLAGWLADSTAHLESLLFNSLEAPAFSKFVALPALLDQLSQEFGVNARMSGSGSCCFLVLPSGFSDEAEKSIERAIRQAWGDEAFFVSTQLA